MQKKNSTQSQLLMTEIPIKFFVQRAEKKDSCVTKPLSPAFHQSENTSLTVNVYIMVVLYHHLIFLSSPSLVTRHCNFDHSTDYITSQYSHLSKTAQDHLSPPQLTASYVPLNAEVYHLWSDMFQIPIKSHILKRADNTDAVYLSINK